MTAVTLSTIEFPSSLDNESFPAEKINEFKQFCSVYNLNVKNMLSVLSAWRNKFGLKSTAKENNESHQIFWGCDFYTNYYHICMGAIESYKLALEKKKHSLDFPSIASLDYTTPLAADDFRNIVSEYVRSHCEKTGEDYFTAMDIIKPKILRAIVEYSCGEYQGFAVYDGKRRYTLFEAFLTDEKYCPPKLPSILGFTTENWQPAFNSPVLQAIL